MQQAQTRANVFLPEDFVQQAVFHGSCIQSQTGLRPTSRASPRPHRQSHKSRVSRVLHRILGPTRLTRSLRGPRASLSLLPLTLASHCLSFSHLSCASLSLLSVSPLSRLALASQSLSALSLSPSFSLISLQPSLFNSLSYSSHYAHASRMATRSPRAACGRGGAPQEAACSALTSAAAIARGAAAR